MIQINTFCNTYSVQFRKRPKQYQVRDGEIRNDAYLVCEQTRGSARACFPPLHLMLTTSRLSAGLLLASLFSAPALAQGISFYISPPRVMATEVTPNTTETFDVQPIGNLASTGTWAIGSYSASSDARVSASSQYGGAGGTRFLEAKSGVTVTLNKPATYIGFWWSAGDASNFMELYDKDGNKLFEFSTAMLRDLLKNDNTTKVTATDQQQYLTKLYYGKPGANPSITPTQNTGEPYAYVHMALTGNSSVAIEKLVVRGSNFELDNISVAEQLAGTPPKPEDVWIPVGSEPLNPVTPNDTATTPVDTPVVIPVHDNDTLPTGTTTTITKNPPISEGSVTINPDGTTTFTPAPGFIGTSTFEYETCVFDSKGAKKCDQATVTVNVVPKPTAADDNFTVLNTGTPVTRELATNDGSNPTGATFKTTSSPNQGGTVVMDPTTGQISYTPAPGFSGTETFTYAVCLPAPNASTCAPATVTLTVPPVDNATVPTTPGKPSTPSTPATPGTPVAVPTPDLPTGTTTTVVTVVPPNGGTVTTDPDNNLVFTPNDYEGDVVVTLQHCLAAPNNGECTQSTVTVQVYTPAPVPPTAVPAMDTWAKLLAMLGLAGFAATRMRRQQRAQRLA